MRVAIKGVVCLCGCHACYLLCIGVSVFVSTLFALRQRDLLLEQVAYVQFSQAFHQRPLTPEELSLLEKAAEASTLANRIERRFEA